MCPFFPTCLAESDALYHRLFSHPLMIEQLVRDFVPEATTVGLDFGGLQRVNVTFHSRRNRRREGDVIWRLPTRGDADVYLYLLLEFQSTSGSGWPKARRKAKPREKPRRCSA